MWSTQPKALVYSMRQKYIFLEFSCFFYPADFGNLISGSSDFSKSSLYIWTFLVHVLLKPSLQDFEHYLVSMCMLVAQSYPAVCNPMDYSPSGASVHRISQVRMLEWVAIPFSRGSSQPRDRTRVSCIAGRFFIFWATRIIWNSYVAAKRAIVKCSTLLEPLGVLFSV